jgi:transposase-like protein
MAKKEKANWEEIILEQKNSGSSIKDFCRDKGIHQNTFYLNRKKLGNTGFAKITPVKGKAESQTEAITIKYKELSIIVNANSNIKAVKDILVILGAV